MASNPQDRPLVTFLLVAYNQSRYVQAAIEAAFSQTYSPLEIVLSDDCSADDTYSVMTDQAAAYRGPHRIILNRNAKNMGIGAHINHAMKLARGEWIVVAAGDDVSLPHRTERLVQTFLESPEETMVVFSDYYEFGDGRPTDYYDAGAKTASLASIVSMCDRHFEGVTGCSASWNRRLFDVFGPMAPHVTFEDRVIPFRGRLLGDIRHVPEALLNYRRHGTNTVGMFTSGTLTDSDKRLRCFLSAYLNNYEDLAVYVDSINPGFDEYGKCKRAIERRVRKLKAYLDIHKGDWASIVGGISALTLLRGNPLQGIRLARRVRKARQHTAI